ncbi:MAG: aminotransferase class V-fold PLP-dependent enzyme [Planctomycetes bacterium]|nr:aminotransferase class V-fold PLP-dependent enzyme [Planctomycetota bacterium]
MARVNPLRAHWTLDPEIRFLNHGSFGACPKPVLARQQELRAELEREPVRFLARELEGRVDAARAVLAPFLGARVEDIVPVSNATTGVNAVLRSLHFEKGDEILLTSQGYNACRNTADLVAEASGARVVVAPVPFPLHSSAEVLAAVFAAVTPRTRLALLDHVTSPTGLVLPIVELVRGLRERGVETLVDGAHAPGMLALDLAALDPAYYTGNLHKWVCAPKGAAFLYVRRELQRAIRPTVISHGANSPRTDRSRFQLEFDFIGTDDPTAFLCVPECLRFLGGLFPGGWDELRRRNRELALRGRASLSAALGVSAPAPESMIGTLVSLPLPPGKASARPDAFAIDPLQRALFDTHRIEVPVFPFPAPPGRLLRISAQIYNEVAEYEALAGALRAEL